MYSLYLAVVHIYYLSFYLVIVHIHYLFFYFAIVHIHSSFFYFLYFGNCFTFIYQSFMFYRILLAIFFIVFYAE